MNIEFEITPSSLTVEENKTVNFDITGDIDSFRTEVLTSEIISIDDKTITGLKAGEGRFKVICEKSGFDETEKEATITVSAASVSPSTPPNPDVNVGVQNPGLLSKDESVKRFIGLTSEWTNTSNLTLNTMVRVTCIDKIHTGTFTKSLTCKQLIMEMIRRKIGNVKFSNEARAKSFIALLREQTKESFGTTITDLQKGMIIKYVIDGSNLANEFDDPNARPRTSINGNEYHDPLHM